MLVKAVLSFIDLLYMKRLVLFLSLMFHRILNLYRTSNNFKWLIWSPPDEGGGTIGWPLKCYNLYKFNMYNISQIVIKAQQKILRMWKDIRHVYIISCIQWSSDTEIRKSFLWALSTLLVYTHCCYSTQKCKSGSIDLLYLLWHLVVPPADSYFTRGTTGTIVNQCNHSAQRAMEGIEVML